MAAFDEITNWRSLAACISADPDMFFPISSAGPALKQVGQAKAICAACQVRLACLDFALATGQIHGVWGGMTEEERQRLRPRAAKRRAAKSRSASQPAPHPRSVSARPGLPVSGRSRPRHPA